MRTIPGLFLITAACGAPAIAPPVPPAKVGAAPAEADAPDVDPCDVTGRWRALPAVSLDGRVDHSAVWSGAEMIVWGGTRGAGNPHHDGGRYDPAADGWRSTDERLAPGPRDDHAAVWTGTEMIVWGGNSYSEFENKLETGGRYDPVADAWKGTPRSGLTARDDPRAVWTGSEMIVWGGRDRRGPTADGAGFDPVTDTWRAIAGDGAPEPREDHTAVWTGSEMIVWGGWNDADDQRDYALHGGRYDPATDTWRAISDAGAPDPREDHTAIWTGTEMIVWGGMVRDGGERRQVATGGRYDPVTDTWAPLTEDGAAAAREDDVVVWTGREMLVWGGLQAGAALGTGARYLPDRDRWCAISEDGAPTARYDHAGVWTGDALVVWGGRDPGGYAPDGAIYVP